MFDPIKTSERGYLTEKVVLAMLALVTSLFLFLPLSLALMQIQLYSKKAHTQIISRLVVMVMFVPSTNRVNTASFSNILVEASRFNLVNTTDTNKQQQERLPYLQSSNLSHETFVLGQRTILRGMTPTMQLTNDFVFGEEKRPEQKMRIFCYKFPKRKRIAKF